MAESPPPTTAISLPLKKNPSQVAQDDTPWPISACSFGSPSQRALAPLATMSERVRDFAGVGGEDEGAPPQVGRRDMRGDELRAKTRRLLAHVLDQLRPLDALGKTGKVLDQGSQGKLAAGLVTFQDQRLKIGAGGVDGRRQTGAARTHDDGVTNLVCHGFLLIRATRRGFRFIRGVHNPIRKSQV